MTEDERKSKTARSASYPSAIFPFLTENSSAGLSAPMETAMERGMSCFLTISMAIGTVVSTPGMPPGAAENSCALSSIECGAWSEPNISMSPARNLL